MQGSNNWSYRVFGGNSDNNAKISSAAQNSTTNLLMNRRIVKIPYIDTSNMTSMNKAFYEFESLESVEGLDTSNVTIMTDMFCKCKSLVSIPELNTNNVTNMSNMFYYCESLVSIPELNAGNVNNINMAIHQCAKLKNFGGFKDIGKAYTQKTANFDSYYVYVYSLEMTHESLMNIINKAYDLNLTYDVANGGTLYTQKMQLRIDNVAKLTAEEIAIATNKGWTVS